MADSNACLDEVAKIYAALAKQETDAIEIDRSLLLENDQIFVVRDSLLDLIDVRPVYFSDKKVVLKDVPEGISILTKPVVGAFDGMLVKKYKRETAKIEN